MTIGVLTSSRADYGIYLPILKKLQTDSFFSIEIIAFGTHLSHFHGHTVDQILSDGFDVNYRVESMLLNDSAEAISTAIGLTTIKFSSFWQRYSNRFDLVFCLGDRYEMFAAVMAAIPFQINFAHLHGGETTLGAIDNIFRHAITLASKCHLVSTNFFARRVEEIIGTSENIYNVGAPGLDNLEQLRFLTNEEFKLKWNIDLTIKTILVTFHPETVNHKMNAVFASQIVDALKHSQEYQILITMPNADTAGNIVRGIFAEAFDGIKHVFLIENLGSQSYFTAMKHCNFMLGNTSSGIIEAASFGKYVINLGDRQKGRLHGENVIDIPIITSEILTAMHSIESRPHLPPNNIYYNGGASDKIKQILKELMETYE